jgi:hypothetical protein
MAAVVIFPMVWKSCGAVSAIPFSATTAQLVTAAAIVLDPPTAERKFYVFDQALQQNVTVNAPSPWLSNCCTRIEAESSFAD